MFASDRNRVETRGAGPEEEGVQLAVSLQLEGSSKMLDDDDDVVGSDVS